MIENKTIICFASGYDAPPTSKHHVMHLISRKNIVLWINYHASRTPTASSSDLRYIIEKLKQVAKGLQQRRKGLYVMTPLVVPVPKYGIVRKFNRFLLVSQVKRALRKIKKGPVQIWSFTPDIVYALGHFDEEKVLYYCVDDHGSFSGYDKAQVYRDEKSLCEKSDLVVTTSVTLQGKKKDWNPDTVLVPHGVDYFHFSRALNENLPCPKDLLEIPRPLLGFFGLIRDWVDVELIAAMAQRRADWHFIMIGDADSNVDLSKYKGLHNMHFLGRKPYADLPVYCRYFNIGIVPFKINELTRSVNPIKLREYLAAGLPVISTPMPDLMLYKNLIEIVSTPDEFEAAAEKCLIMTENDRLKLSSEMSKETWEQKVEEICSRLSVQ